MDCNKSPEKERELSNIINPKADQGRLDIYQIRINGQLDSQWTEEFEGMAITLEENGDTLITGPVVDQAALYGLLKKIRDLGVPLVSICPSQPNNFGSSSYKKEK